MIDHTNPPQSVPDQAPPIKRFRTPEYRCWAMMLTRCRNPNHTNWKDYGGRGITVDPRWFNYLNFYEDMGPRPGPAFTIERIDNDGPYCKSNCRWATRKEQNRNKRTTRFIEFNGRRMCLAAWVEETGLSKKAIQRRLELGWPVDRALTEPVHEAMQRFA